MFSTATLIAALLVAFIVARLAILAPRLALVVVVFMVFMLTAMVLGVIFKRLRTSIRRL